MHAEAKNPTYYITEIEKWAAEGLTVRIDETANIIASQAVV